MHPKSIPTILTLMLVCASPHAMGKAALAARPCSSFGEKLFQRPEIRNAPKKIIAFAWKNPKKILLLSLALYIFKRSFSGVIFGKQDKDKKRNVENHSAEVCLENVKDIILDLKKLDLGAQSQENNFHVDDKDRKKELRKKELEESLVLATIPAVMALLRLPDDRLELALKDHVRYAHANDLRKIAFSLAKFYQSRPYKKDLGLHKKLIATKNKVYGVHKFIFHDEDLSAIGAHAQWLEEKKKDPHGKLLQDPKIFLQGEEGEEFNAKYHNQREKKFQDMKRPIEREQKEILSAMAKHIQSLAGFKVIKHSVESLQKEILAFFETMPECIAIIPGKEVELRKRLPKILDRVARCAYFKEAQGERDWHNYLPKITGDIIGVLTEGIINKDEDEKRRDPLNDFLVLNRFLDLCARIYKEDNAGANDSAFDFFKFLMPELVEWAKLETKDERLATLDKKTTEYQEDRRRRAQMQREEREADQY